MPIENMNVEKLRATKINTNKFTEVRLKWIQKSAFPPCSLPPTPMFSFLKWLLRSSNKDTSQLDWQLNYL